MMMITQSVPYVTIGNYAKDLGFPAFVDHFNKPDQVIYIKDYGKDMIERYDLLITLKNGFYTFNINEVGIGYHHKESSFQDCLYFLKFSGLGTSIEWKQLPAMVQRAVLKDISHTDKLVVHH